MLQLNDRLKEMEKELDSLIQLKQVSIDDVPTTVIPTVTTIVPSSLATSFAPTTPMPIALPASTPTTSATRSIAASSTGDEENGLI